MYWNEKVNALIASREEPDTVERGLLARRAFFKYILRCRVRIYNLKMENRYGNID